MAAMTATSPQTIQLKVQQKLLHPGDRNLLFYENILWKQLQQQRDFAALCYDKQFRDAIQTFVHTSVQSPDILNFLKLFRRKHSGTNESALCPQKCRGIMA